MMNEKVIKGLEDRGFNRRVSEKSNRLYLNLETLGIESETVDENGRRTAILKDGSKIDGYYGASIFGTVTYIDTKSGKIYSTASGKEFWDLVRGLYFKAVEEAKETIEVAKDEDGNTYSVKIVNGKYIALKNGKTMHLPKEENLADAVMNMLDEVDGDYTVTNESVKKSLVEYGYEV